MKAIAIFILFIGMFLVIQGYYSQVANIKNTPTIVYKYIPRSIYDEQLSSDPSLMVSQQFKSMFENINPWPPLSVSNNNSQGIQTNQQIISQTPVLTSSESSTSIIPSQPTISNDTNANINSTTTVTQNFEILNAFDYNRT